MAPNNTSDDSDAGGFPGFSDSAPLDLSAVSVAAERAMLARITDHSFGAFADTAAAVHNCARPIRLVGRSDTIDPATGEILGSFSSAEAPLGVLYRPCGNRRADICPACSRIYARDTFEMIRAGVAGGKTVPDTVADNPLLFITVTAPSFGPVHGSRRKNGQRSGGRCRPRSHDGVCVHGLPTRCMKVHDHDDPVNGSPLCWDCYDWSTAVVWQWWAPELWRRTPNTLRRMIATELGVAEGRLGERASLQFAKVAEYQDRGLVHFHALIRLDGPGGPGSTAPLMADTLAGLVEQTVRAVQLTAPGVDADDLDRVIAWGEQLDIRVVRDRTRTDDPLGPLTAEQVAGYLAKYATKDAAGVRTPDPACARICSGWPRPAGPWLTGLPQPIPRSHQTARIGYWASGCTCSGSAATTPPNPGATPSPSANSAAPDTASNSSPPPRPAPANPSTHVILKPACSRTRRRPHWWSGPGPTRAPAGPTPATKHWPSPRPPVPASTPNGRPNNTAPTATEPRDQSPAFPDSQPALGSGPAGQG
jgi:hypothetical protein